MFGSIASETLFEPSNSDTAVVDVIFVQSVEQARWSSGDHFGNDRRSVLSWHTGELGVPLTRVLRQ